MADSRTPGSNTQEAIKDLVAAQSRGAGQSELLTLQEAIAEARRVEDDPAPDLVSVAAQWEMAKARGAPTDVIVSLFQKVQAAERRETGITLDPTALVASIIDARRQGLSPSAIQGLETQLILAIERIDEPNVLFRLLAQTEGGGFSRTTREAIAKRHIASVGQKLERESSITDPFQRYQRLMQQIQAQGSPLLTSRYQKSFEESQTEPVDATWLANAITEARGRAHGDRGRRQRQLAYIANVLRPQADAALQRELAAIATNEAPSDQWRGALAAVERRKGPPELLAALRAGLDRQLATEARIARGLEPPRPPAAEAPPLPGTFDVPKAKSSKLAELAVLGLFLTPALVAWWMTRDT